jgi:D-proline reductase (dithiol) PrdB
LCHRTVVTIQRSIETQGISTILITVSPNESEPAGPPRALYPKPFQPGSSLGKPHDRELQMRILQEALGLIHYPAEPGTIIMREYGE